MRRAASLVLLIGAVAGLCNVAIADSQRPRRLPPPDQFKLTLAIASDKEAQLLPESSSCLGQAARMLPCRAVTVTLKNIGKQFVRISGEKCRPEDFRIDVTSLDHPDGWWPTSRPDYACIMKEEPEWTNTKLAPGQSLSYVTRLISPHRSFETLFMFKTTDFEVRAEWTLFGCIDKDANDDCLTPMQWMHHADPAPPQVNDQAPLTLRSNAVVVHIEPPGEEPKLSFFFQTDDVFHGWGDEPNPEKDPHCPPGVRSMECQRFHYVVRNLSETTVRVGWMSCSGAPILPEYRDGWGKGEWHFFAPAQWDCARNVFESHPLSPGGRLEGDFVLRELRPHFDMTPIANGETRSLRFRFEPVACPASPDGSFCLFPFKPQQEVIGNVRAVGGDKAFSPMNDK